MDQHAPCFMHVEVRSLMGDRMTTYVGDIARLAIFPARDKWAPMARTIPLSIRLRRAAGAGELPFKAQRPLGKCRKTRLELAQAAMIFSELLHLSTSTRLKTKSLGKFLYQLILKLFHVFHSRFAP